ncbi:MAG: S-layer homology domain-containing protein, partial [Proteocatella sp.]
MSKKNSGNRRFLSLILSILMIFTTIPLDAYAAEATDISNHWAQDTIESWMEQGLAKGYPDGSFKPDNNITRAEFVAMVNRAFRYTLTVPISYSDVKVGDWYYNSIEIAVAAGYIGGYPDGTMKPENPITREEAAALLVKMNKLMENESAANAFTDAANFSWSKGSIGAVFEAGLMGGYPDGSFGNHKFIKRGEAVVVLDRNLKYVMGTIAPAVTGNDTTPISETSLSFIADEEISSGDGSSSSSSGGGGGGGGSSDGDFSVAVSAITITGTAKIGVELTATPAPTVATVTYQWKISTDGTTYTDISGATTNKYTPVAGDVNKFIKIVATGTGSYSGTVTSVATAKVTTVPVPVKPAAPAVTGDDTTNKVSGMAAGMEYKLDGAADYAAYVQAAFDAID